MCPTLRKCGDCLQAGTTGDYCGFRCGLDYDRWKLSLGLAPTTFVAFSQRISRVLADLLPLRHASEHRDIFRGVSLRRFPCLSVDVFANLNVESSSKTTRFDDFKSLDFNTIP